MEKQMNNFERYTKLMNNYDVFVNDANVNVNEGNSSNIVAALNQRARL